jgi:carbon monoxide dehydrogenase subunit G
MRKIQIIAVPVVAIGVLLAVAATRPNTFRVQRTGRIKAPPDKIYAFIDDFHRWPAWSPYENRDPAMKRSYEGAQSGVGAVYNWNGNKDVGSGRMEILDSKPGSKVTIKLDFLEPFEGHNTAEFTLEPEGDATDVTWSMNGPLAFVPRVMGMFMSMDSMIGKDFEAGLSNLKTQAEK